jgi:3-phenylpropionate/trans-cinnamate dioxygenase ferredoxin reductase subunit
VSYARTDILIVGAGLAGARTAESLRALGHDGTIQLLGSEPHPPYERPALSKAFLLGKRSPSDLALRSSRFWRDHAVDLQLGAAAESIDVVGRRAVVDGRHVRWGALVLATGLRARRLPIMEGITGVFHLRTLDDAANLSTVLAPGARLVIIGAGFIGLEVASSARLQGVDVTVIDIAPVPFAATLGSAVGSHMAELARDAGVQLLMGRSIQRPIAVGGRLVALELADGTRLECDAVLVGVGARPNTEIAGGRVMVERDGGFSVNAHGRTTAPDVYACGDVASPPGGRVEHWSAAAAGAQTVAHTLAGVPPPRTGPSYFWTDQFGSRLQVVGRVSSQLEAQVAPADGRFVARYLTAAGRLAGVALLDRPDLLAQARAEILASTRGAGSRGRVAA